VGVHVQRRTLASHARGRAGECSLLVVSTEAIAPAEGNGGGEACKKKAAKRETERDAGREGEGERERERELLFSLVFFKCGFFVLQTHTREALHEEGNVKNTALLNLVSYRRVPDIVS
jgi:hypothetical protein